MKTRTPRKAHARNTVFNAIGEGLWGFALAFHNVNSVIPMFLAQLGASAFIIGLIPGGFILLLALPQVISAALFHRTRDIKRLNIMLHFMLVPFSLALVVVFMVFKVTGSAGIMLYMLIWMTYSLGIGLLVPVWADFLASVTVPSRRGRFFGITFTVNALLGMAGGYILKIILSSDTFSFPENFGFGWLIMTISVILGSSFFIFMQVIQKQEEPKEDSGHMFQRLKKIYTQDRNYRNYIYSRMLGAASLAPLAFFAVDLQQRFDLPLSAAGTFTFFLVLGQAVFNMLFGYIGDMYSRKISISGFFIGHILAIIFAMYAIHPWMGYAVFVFVGMGFGAGQSSFMVFVYEFAGESGDRKLYYAALDTAVAPVLFLYISISGLIVENFGHTTLYLGSLLLVFAGLMMFVGRVRSPQPT